ncbi:MAG: hypothetical protein IJV91_05670 [Kiritimatiellae bacterium]|nr:hypothetical protein [Kiritimatiellia bacterium]
MSKTAIEYASEYITGMMGGLALPHAPWRYNKTPIPDMYFISDYTEVSSATAEENGMRPVTAILRGYTRGDMLSLFVAAGKIEKNCAKTVILPDGTGIAVFYDSSMPVPTGNDEIKSIKINLNMQIWRVN